MLLRVAIFAFACWGWSCAAAQQHEEERTTSQLLVEQFGGSLGITNPEEVFLMAPLALDLVKHFEQWKPHAYDDPAGYCTIGFGHLIALARCESVQLGKFEAGITEAEGIRLLDTDTLGARLAVQELVTVRLTEAQSGALSSFVFNVGRGAFSRSTLLRLLNDGEYDLASLEFRRWVRARGRILRGLIARRACEESLFRHTLTYGVDGTFDRSRCTSSLGAAEDTGPLIDVEVGEK